MNLQTEAQYRQELATCWQMIEQDRAEIKSLRQRNGDLVTGLEACDEQVVALRQQLGSTEDHLRIVEQAFEKRVFELERKNNRWLKAVRLIDGLAVRPMKARRLTRI